MGFEKWGYKFDGPFHSPEKLQAHSGIYVIWCRGEKNWTVLDVGEAADVNERVSNLDRVNCWSRNCLGIICYSAIYTPNLQQEGRMELEKKIKSITNPPCGEN